MIDQYTFGKTPAALYLSRRLIELNSPALTRACTIRVNTACANVSGIMFAVEEGTLAAKVAANLLRLLREEATSIVLDTSFDDDLFVGQLLRNVIIGRIKRAIRLVSTVRKIENGSTDLTKAKRKGKMVHYETLKHHSFEILGCTAGIVFPDGEYIQCSIAPSKLKDDITPETLMAKSNKRCARQGKPHMAV